MPAPKDKYFDLHKLLKYLKVMKESIEIELRDDRAKIGVIYKEFPIKVLEVTFKNIEKNLIRYNEIKHIEEFIHSHGFILEDEQDV